MKTTIMGLMLMGSVCSSFAIDKAELDSRIQKLSARLEALQQKPDKSIPAENLRKAQGIILLDRTKAGFLFAYQGGSGVALVRDSNSDKWSPVAFLSANEASLGFQVGGEQGFYAILLMNTNATRLLTEPTFEFGGEARGTAGDTSDGVKGTLNTTDQPFLVYGDRKGFYGGAVIKGGAIAPDDEANRVYYGQSLTLKEILFEKKVQPIEAALQLAERINGASKLTRK
jgi:lipid-binding SYLF domain-containing protein